MKGQRLILQGSLMPDSDGDGLALQLAVAGLTRPVTGYGKGVRLQADTLRAGVSAGLFDGVPIFYRHEHPQARDVRDMAAVTHASIFDEAAGAVCCKAAPYSNAAGAFLQSLAEDFGRQQASGLKLPDVGLSLDAWFTLETGGEIPVSKELVEVSSVDVVFRPAASGRLLAQTLNGDDIFEGHNGRGEMTVMEETVVNGTEVERDDSGWSDALRQATVRALLATSGLPEPTRQRLEQGSYSEPGQVEAAIVQARAELAALAESKIIQLGGGPPRTRAVHSGDMSAPLDRARNAVEWFFGVQGSNTPSPSERRFDLLYVALTGDVNFTGRYDAAHVQLAMATTSTLADLAVNAMNKVVAQQFSRLTYWRWFERVTRVIPNDGTLHDMQWLSYGGTGNLPSLGEGQAYPEGNIGDARETDSFTKYGRYVGITRRMIKNSDIQRIQAVPEALATDALRTRSAAIASIFTINSGVGPTLDDDSTALFHSNHSNVDTTALDADGWEAAAIECFGHTEAWSGKAIGVFPRYCLVPVDLYHDALAVFGYGDGYPTTYNVWADERGSDDPRPFPVIVPDWSDANDWAYVADPAVWPVLMMSYSQNPGGGSHPLPELFSVTSETAGLMFTNDVLPIKVRDEFAYGVNGPRGIGKRNVT